jgi:hypothetical protein
MKIAYAALLRLYPAPFREVFAREMADVFEEVGADRRARGFFEYIAFLFSEIAGTLGGAFRMWSAGLIERSRRRLVISYWVSIAAGVAITAFFQGILYTNMTRTRFAVVGDRPLPAVVPVSFLALLIAACLLVFLGVFSIAVVWNMRMIGNRAGRLKPIWMPAGEMRGAWRLQNRRKRVSQVSRAKTRALPIYNLDRPE